MLSRIWSDVYGLRSELIQREAARDDPEQTAAFSDAATGSRWYLARLLTALDRYMDRYGTTILHGASEFDARSLTRVAGWSGEVGEAEARELRFLMARVGEWDRRVFETAID